MHKSQTSPAQCNGRQIRVVYDTFSQEMIAFVGAVGMSSLQQGSQRANRHWRNLNSLWIRWRTDPTNLYFLPNSNDRRSFKAVHITTTSKSYFSSCIFVQFIVVQLYEKMHGGGCCLRQCFCRRLHHRGIANCVWRTSKSSLNVTVRSESVT